MQQKYKKKHPEHPDWEISKYVTAVIKPGESQNEIKVECYMVSDQCQAMERDDVFGES